MDNASIVLVLLLLSLCGVTTPTANGRSVLGKQGFRVPARRHIPKHAVIKRHTGGVDLTSDAGGWIVPVLISGQELTLNVDTGSSDM